MAKMWFGTRNYMTWVECPAVGVDSSKFDWNNQTNFLNGGANVRRSTNSHKEFQLSWNMTSRENIRAISDFADGFYGGGPIYWADPFTMDTNMMPAQWGAMYLNTKDGTAYAGTRPIQVNTDANSLGYPTYSAQYTISASDTQPSVWIPIPPGYTAWVGAKGTSGSGGLLRAIPTTGPSSTGTAVTIAPTAVGSTTRVTQSFANSAGYDGVLITLGGSGTITLTSVIVQVLKDGTTPKTGGFISGQGHSGCTFAAQPTLNNYSAALDKVGLTAKLVETQAWV